MGLLLMALLVLPLFTVIAGVAILPVSFLAMLLLGSLHSDVSSVPALGFWTVWKIMWLVAIAGSLWKGSDVSTSPKK